MPLRDWNPPLRNSTGAQRRLAGISILHDFEWNSIFPDNRRQFRNGLQLAQLVRNKCPPHLTPVLLLTIREDVAERSFEDNDRFIVVVRIRRYLELAGGDSATTYFAMLLPTNVIAAQALDWSRMASHEIQGILLKTLTPDCLEAWLAVQNNQSSVLASLIPEASQLHNFLAHILTTRPEAVSILRSLFSSQPELLQELLAFGPTLSDIGLPLVLGVARQLNLLANVIPQDANLVPLLLPDVQRRLLTELYQQLGNDFWAALDAVGLSLPSAILSSQVADRRRTALGQFEEMLSRETASELEWQRYFQQNTWVFGYGLTYQFLSVVAERPELGGRDVTGVGGVQGDFICATEANVRFTVLVEIKRPSTPLLRDNLYRNRTYAPSDELSGAVAQVQQQCYQWAVHDSQTPENRERLEGCNIYTYQPRGMVVVGNTSSLTDLARRRSFEVLRRSLTLPEIVTYDELLERARYVLGE